MDEPQGNSPAGEAGPVSLAATRSSAPAFQMLCDGPFNHATDQFVLIETTLPSRIGNKASFGHPGTGIGFEEVEVVFRQDQIGSTAGTQIQFHMDLFDGTGQFQLKLRFNIGWTAIFERTQLSQLGVDILATVFDLTIERNPRRQADLHWLQDLRLGSLDRADLCEAKFISPGE